MKLRFVLPTLIVIAVMALLAAGLARNPRKVPSPLIGKPAPTFTAPLLHDPEQTFELADMRGQVWLLNVWASWCVACRAEHGELIAISRGGKVPLYGLDYKDSRAAAVSLLARRGDPYLASVVDPGGEIGMNFGVYGVPETYVIDANGVIRYKQIGPLTPEVVHNKILPLVAELSQ